MRNKIDSRKNSRILSFNKRMIDKSFLSENLEKSKKNRVRESITSVDSLGNQLSQEQINYFKNSKVRDKDGNLIVCYHGTPNPGFKEFNPKDSKSQFGKYKFDKYNVNYFTTDKKSATSYTEIGIEENDNVYACYLNIVNPFIVDNKTTADIKSSFNIQDDRVRQKQKALFEKIWDKWCDSFLFDEDDLDNINNDLAKLNYALIPSSERDDNSNYTTEEGYYDLYCLGNNSLYGGKRIAMYAYTLDEFFDSDMYDEVKENILGYEEDEDYVLYSTDDIVRYVIAMNEDDGTNYDGIIISDIIDSKDMFSAITTDYITLISSNQIKLINNKKPTSSNRIDEDVKDSGEYYYRGYNSKYNILDNGVKGASLYTWVTDSLEYANEYAKHNYGKVAKIKLKCSDDAIGSVMELPEYIDYYEPGDDAFKEYILDNDFKGYGFEVDEWDAYCLCVSKDVCEIIDADVDTSELSLEEEMIETDFYETDVLATDSEYEIKNKILALNYDVLRVFIDEKNDLYLLGDGWNLTHIKMIDLAKEHYYDTSYDDYDRNKLCIVVSTFTSDNNPRFNEWDALEDDYQYVYYYDIGNGDTSGRFCIYSRGYRFTTFKLAKLLSRYLEDSCTVKSLTRESLKEKKMYRGATNLPDRTSFRGYTKWFTTNKDYADSFAQHNWIYKDGSQDSKTYVVDVDTDNLNIYDCGVTDYPVYSIRRPIKPYQLSPLMVEMVKGLGLDEKGAYDLVDKVIQEIKQDDKYKLYNDEAIFKLKLWQIVKSKVFADLVKSKGYDGVRTVEFNNECYGIFNDKDITILTEDLIVRYKGKNKKLEEDDDIVLQDEQEDDIMIDDTVENDKPLDLSRSTEILSLMYKKTHYKNERGETMPSYCFADEIMNVYGLSQEEVIDIALKNNYKIMKVFPNEIIDGGILIADKGCSSSQIKNDYAKFYDVEADVEDYKG